MSLHSLTADSTLVLPGISRPFTVAVSGAFGGGSLAVNYATGEPATASLTFGDDDAALLMTSPMPGGRSNAITVALIDPAAPNAALSFTWDGTALVVSLATGPGAHAVLTTALAGANNDITLTALAAGPAGNAFSLQLLDPAANNAALVITTANNLDFVAHLATGDAGAITTTAAQLITALAAYAPFAYLMTAANAAANTGAGVVIALAKTHLAGGGANAAITTTAKALVNHLYATDYSGPPVTLAADSDGTGLLAALAETPLADGSDGTFATYQSGETGTFTEPGERRFDPVGINPNLQLVLSGSADPALVVIVREQRQP